MYLVNLLYASGSINRLKHSADYLDTDVKELDPSEGSLDQLPRIDIG